MSGLARTDTYNSVITIVVDKLSIDNGTSINGAMTLQDLGADSLDILEIIMNFEEQFDIEIDDERAESLETLDEVVDYVHALRTQ